MLAKAKLRFDAMTDLEKDLLEQNIIAGLPGGEGSYDRQGILSAITEFIQLGTEKFRENLIEFLREIIPVAEEAGVDMCIHPDDPPFSLFGLPRVVSTADDVRTLFDAVPSTANGLTLCAGSFGVRADNNLVGMVKEFGNKIHFIRISNRGPIHINSPFFRKRTFRLTLPVRRDHIHRITPVDQSFCKFKGSS